MSSADTGTGKAFTKFIHKALRAYHRDEALAELTLQLDLALVRDGLRHHSDQEKAAVFRAILDTGIDSLARIDPNAATIVVQHFVHHKTSVAVARAHNYSLRAFYDKQHRALTALAQIIWAAEEKAREKQRSSDTLNAILDALPPPTFTRLFGVQKFLDQLAMFLGDDDHCWMVAIEGMGGIGKTALARQAVEEMVRAGRFQWVFWITARQQIFSWGSIQHVPQPALTYPMLLDALAEALALPPLSKADVAGNVRLLRAELHKRTPLIVVDNLETAADIKALVRGLHALARPTKILLTTRHRIGAYDQITPLTLHKLLPDDAHAFIRHHAQKHNIIPLRDAPHQQLKRIAAITDANPLAIKLVLGQMHSRPAAQVLDDLAKARPPTHDFYQFIFRQSWEQISELAQHLLLHMPLLDPRGCTDQVLSDISGNPLDTDFRLALEELARTSLLNVGYQQQTMLLSIHRLTEYFILSDLVGGDIASVSF